MPKRITIQIADITRQPVDAIVNAANRFLLGGSGVDGAIHKAAGPQLRDECATYPTDANGYRLQTGDAKITKGYNLPAKYVIHTVGPDCRTHEFASNPVARDAALASSYRRSLEVAKENGCKSVAFPAISIGIYKFPLERAAQIAAEVIGDFLAQEKDMSVCLCILVPGQPTKETEILSAYEKALAANSKTQVRKTRATKKATKSVRKDDFPETLTAEMLAGFVQTQNGATCPHHGFIDGVHYIAKCTKYAELNPYGHPSDDHVHNEYLADCFLRAAGLKVPESREYRVDFHDGHGPRIVRLARFIENTIPLATAFAKTDSPGYLTDKVLEAYPILSFAAAIDTFQNDNALVDANGEVWFVDNGADFDFRALGRRKGWWFDRKDIDDPETGYLALHNYPNAVQLRTIMPLPDSTIWGAASNFDFEGLANLLPDELRTESVLNYARALHMRVNPDRPASPAPSTGNDFIANCAESIRILESLHGYSRMRGIVKSFGNVYGIKCVASGDFDSCSTDEDKVGTFELHTDRGEFKIVRGLWNGLGVIEVELREGLVVSYADVRLVVAIGLLNLGRFDAKSHEYKFGDERKGCFKTNLPFEAGDWVELRGMSEDWAWDIASRMWSPFCLDQFEHFCRDIAWINEEGHLIVDPNEIVSSNEYLLRLEACYRNKMYDAHSVIAQDLQDNLIAIKDLLKSDD